MGLAELLLGKDNPFTQWVGGNQNLLNTIGAGLGQGQNIQSGLSAGLAAVPEAKALDRAASEKAKADAKVLAQENVTKAWLEQNYPQYAHLPVEQGWQLAMDAEKSKFDGAGGGGENFFGNGVPIQLPDGSVAYGQFGNRGSFNVPKLPDGATFLTPVQQLNTGTEFTGVNKFGTPTGSTTAINNEGAAADTGRGKVIGEAQGAATVAAPKDAAAAENALNIVEQIRKHPALSIATGSTAPLNQFLVGTTRFDFENLVNQAKSGAFLTVIEQMRGLGSLSNAEGQTATAAVNRMNTASTKEGFLKALDDYEAIIKQGLARAQAKMQPGTVPAAASNDPLGIR